MRICKQVSIVSKVCAVRRATYSVKLELTVYSKQYYSYTHMNLVYIVILNNIRLNFQLIQAHFPLNLGLISSYILISLSDVLPYCPPPLLARSPAPGPGPANGVFCSIFPTPKLGIYDRQEGMLSPIYVSVSALREDCCKVEVSIICVYMYLCKYVISIYM